MKKYFILLTYTFLSLVGYTQQQNVITLTPEEAEAIFLKQNLLLIAEQLNVDIADAAISQAKLWENPELSISSVNLWSTRSQRDGEDELIPPLFGSFAKNTQFTAELSQLIQTANKRGKLIKREKLSKEMAVQEFEDILRGLKTELRKTINEVAYLQSYYNALDIQQESLSRLISTYKNQVSKGNIAKSELIRLQTSALELDSEINEIQTELNSQQKNLKILLGVNHTSTVEIVNADKMPITPQNIQLADLQEKSALLRPDLVKQEIETRYHEKSLAYEKSLRAPDFTIGASYDRFGGVWKDFVGFGVSFNIPILNRNQGNIKAAKASIRQSQYLMQYQQSVVQNEVVEAYNSYSQIYKLYEKINNENLLAELDNMLDVYTKNLMSRNISLLEYTDFMDAYRLGKQTILMSRKKVYDSFEELQYVVGTEIK